MTRLPKGVDDETADRSNTADALSSPGHARVSSRLQTSDWVALAFLVITLLVWLMHLRVGWGHATMTGHEFRQTQTALTIQSVERDGLRLDYSTPVLGKPWAIPMEFPLYQWGAAGVGELTGLETVQAGRLVSVLAFLLGLPAVLLILRDLGFSWGAGFGVLALLVATPVYAFYSATVLIESTAWSASCWFLWAVLGYRRSERLRYLVFAAFVGAIAVLVKPTSWAVACLPWAGLWLADGWRLRSGGNWRPWLLQAGVLGIGLLALGFAWVNYADYIKAQNPIAHFLLSSELTGFNFGTWEMKVTAATWESLAQHWHRGIVAAPALAIGLLVSLLWRPTRIVALLGVIAFVGIQLIFTNLYVAHDYYLYANASYLVVAFSVGLAYWWDRSTVVWKSKLPAGLILAAIATTQIHLYRTELFQGILDRPAHEPKFTTVVRQLTNPDDVIVGHMGEWNAWLPFYSQRRALMLPDTQMRNFPSKVEQSVRLLADESVPLLVVQGESNQQPVWFSQRISQLNLHPVPLLVWNHSTTLFARSDRYAEMLARARLLDHAEISLPEDDPLKSSDRIPILSPEVREQIRPALEAIPVAGNFAHGVNVTFIEGSESLSIHATSELLFSIPEDSRSVLLSYFIPEHVFSERDFDGLLVVVEQWDAATNSVTLSQDWLSTEEGYAPRELTLSLPDGGSRRLLLRVEPGPFDQAAYDQAWLRSLRFSPDAVDQTTSAK